MGRPERPLDYDGPISEFARGLRDLRAQAGSPSYRELAARALYVPSVLSSAASGYRLPTLAVTLAFVAACGGDCAAWERRWRTVAGNLWTDADPRAHSPRPAPLDTVAAAPGPPRPLARPAQLPVGSSVFVGRRALLARAREYLRDAADTTSAAVKSTAVGNPAVKSAVATKSPLVVRGPIGVGKTAFALRLAEQLAAGFPDGALYADLSACGPGNQCTDEVLRGFVLALGIPAHLVPDDPMQRVGLYRSLLAQRRLFVLLENAPDEDQVRPLLARTASSQVVVTSRARLLGLDGVRALELGALERGESVTLLTRLVGDERAAGAQAKADADALAELCGDLPLALSVLGRKLAARPAWSLQYAAGLLADRERMMANLRVGDVAVRERLAAAYQLLSAEGRRALRHLGEAGPGWTSAAQIAGALQVSAETAEELLEAAVDVGLLAAAETAGRYRVPAVLSAFAASARLHCEQPTAPPAQAGARPGRSELPARRQVRARPARI